MSVIFQDTFTGTATTQLQSHTPDIGTSWTRLFGSNAIIDWVINASNQITPESDQDDGVIYTADATYPSPDYALQWTLVVQSATTQRATYGLVRVQDQENMYAVYIRGGSSQSQLYKKVSGTWSALGSAFNAPADGSVCKLEIVGSTLTFYDDGVSVSSVSDSDITATGKAGIACGGGSELITSTDDSHNQNIWDTLSVTSYSRGTTSTTLATITSSLLGTVEVKASLSSTLDDVSKIIEGTVSGGAGEISGSLSVTLENISTSITGTVDVLGTLDTDLDDISVSIVGTNPNLGSLDKTLDSISLVATTTVEVKGSLTSALDTVGISSSGTNPNLGNLDDTLDDISSNIAGTVLVTAVSTVTLGSVGLSGAGTVSVVGSLSSTLDDISLSTEVKVDIFAGLTNTLNDIGVDSDGVVGNPPTEGSLNLTLESLSVSSSATVLVNGSLNKSLDDLTKSLTGTVLVTAQTNTTLENVSNSITGGILVQGNLSNTLSNISITSNGTVVGEVQGQLDQTLSSIVISSNGIVGELFVNGTLDQTLDQIQISSSVNIQTVSAINEISVSVVNDRYVKAFSNNTLLGFSERQIKVKRN